MIVQNKKTQLTQTFQVTYFKLNYSKKIPNSNKLLGNKKIQIMKNLFKLTFFIAIVALFTTSCNEGNPTQDNIVVPEPEVMNQSQQQMYSLVSSDTSGCYTVSIPISFVLEDGSIVSVSSEVEFETLFEAPPYPVDFSYPIELINLSTGETVSASDNEELDSYLFGCETGTGTGGAFNSYYCYQQNFPVVFTLEDGSAATANSSDDVAAIFNSSNQPVGYGFPVNLTNELGESFIANDTSELTLLLEECDMTGTGTGGNFGTYSCYDIVFPVNFDLPDGTSFTVNSQDDFPSDFSFLQWTLGYPMTLFNPATGNLIANSEAELDDLLEDCTNIGNGGGNNVGSIVYSMTVITIENPDTTGTINIPDCYDYQYPISVIDINQNVQTANDDDAFIAIIQSGIEVEGFVYPISVIDTATGQTLTANSDDDVIVWIENCL